MELFSKCIFYLYAHVSHLSNEKKEFLKKEIEKYDRYAHLPMTREHKRTNLMARLMKEGKLIW
jgi:hypothetical protein